MIKSIEHLLKHRHTEYLYWDEPWRGVTVDGNDIDCHATVKMTVHDCINLCRYRLLQAAKTEDQRQHIEHLTDELLLDEFIIVNWAYCKENY